MSRISSIGIALILYHIMVSPTMSATLASEHYLEQLYPRSCQNLTKTQMSHGHIQQIMVNLNTEPFFVKCNFEIEGGGWTMVLNRFDNRHSFNCTWQECKKGFGNINEEFFIGLRKLHDITNSRLHELLFVFEDFDNVRSLARYNAFAIGDESTRFHISVLGTYSGSAGDSFRITAGEKFATLDNDVLPRGCAKMKGNPGWFNYCTEANLFGQHYNAAINKDLNGMYWKSFREHYSLKKLSMYVRPLYDVNN